MSETLQYKLLSSLYGTDKPINTLKQVWQPQLQNFKNARKK